MALMLVDSEKLRKMANYVAATQKVIEKQAAVEGALTEKAPQVADILVREGLLESNLKESQVAEFVENPEILCTAVEKVASLDKRAVEMGTSVESMPIESKSANDVFVDRIMS